MFIDLNCDLGESFGNYKCGLDEEVIKYISSANIACGFHASDPVVMDYTVRLAAKNNVSIGAHPGYPDLQGFGRRNMAVAPKDAKCMVQYQIGALNAFCKAAGVRMNHVKPHGALYNMAAKDEKLAAAICEAIYEVDDKLILLGLSGSCFEKAAKDTGIAFAKEVFADRAYEEDGTLVPRSKPGAVLTDENDAINQVIGLVKNNTVRTITGKVIEMAADSICVHGDGVKAVQFVKMINERFDAEGIALSHLNML